jgi:membrane-bound ClpP family serine protease
MDSASSEAVMMIIVMPTMFVMMAWAFKALLNFVQQRQLTKVHYALQDKLIEKLGNSPEAIEYLHSDAGEKMFALASKERTNPYSRILTALQAGAVISLLGIGFIFLRGQVTQEGAEAFTVIGVLGLCLGLGFLASSGAAYFFSKSWGLINGSPEADA